MDGICGTGCVRSMMTVIRARFLFIKKQARLSVMPAAHAAEISLISI